jgi:hypothetical protein
MSSFHVVDEALPHPDVSGDPGRAPLLRPLQAEVLPVGPGGIEDRVLPGPGADDGGDGPPAGPPVGLDGVEPVDDEVAPALDEPNLDGWELRPAAEGLGQVLGVVGVQPADRAWRAWSVTMSARGRSATLLSGMLIARPLPSRRPPSHR